MSWLICLFRIHHCQQNYKYPQCTNPTIVSQNFSIIYWLSAIHNHPCSNMDRSMFSSTKLQLAQERRLKFQGTAKINISQISLPSEYKPDNIERLRCIFDNEDCNQLSLPNHVMATISREHLISALSSNKVNTNTLMSQSPDSYVTLEFLIKQMTCLHRQHHLRAGREFLASYN